MKLESLKSSKFEAFKGNDLMNAIGIVGGEVRCVNTYKNATDTTACDSFQYGDSVDIKFTDGTQADKFDTICSVGPSEGQGGVIKTN